MANPVGSFLWYELMSPDADASASFYGDVVGWQVAGRTAPPGAQDYRMIGRADGGAAGGVLQLTPQMLEHGAHPGWVGYLHVADVRAAVTAIEADGGKILMPPFDLPVGSIAMVTDPMGTPFYVMKPIPPPDKPDATSDVFDVVKPQHVRWNELASPDLARAKAFYARHFGFAFNEAMPMGELGDYCFIDHGGKRIGAIMQKPGASPIASWLFYFGVASVTAAMAAIEAGGGKLMMGPNPIPGGECTVVATDPHGVPFGIVGPKGE